MLFVLRRRRKFAEGLVRRWLPLALALGLLAESAPADDLELSYDLYSRDKQLTVWVDLSPFADASTVARLEDGIDVLLECQASLSVPRRFFGDKLAARKTTTRRLSYRSVTEEFLVTDLQGQDETTLSFASLASLFQHFKDSIEIVLAPLDSLKARERYVLTLDITTISLTDLNLGPTEASRDESESPLRFLFRQFLDITDYGRSEYSTRSRPFSLDEIEPEP